MKPSKYSKMLLKNTLIVLAISSIISAQECEVVLSAVSKGINIGEAKFVPDANAKHVNIYVKYEYSELSIDEINYSISLKFQIDNTKEPHREIKYLPRDEPKIKLLKQLLQKLVNDNFKPLQ